MADGTGEFTIVLWLKCDAATTAQNESYKNKNIFLASKTVCQKTIFKVYPYNELI